MIKFFGTALLVLLFISLYAKRSSAQYVASAVGEDLRTWSGSRSEVLSVAQAPPETGEPAVAEAQALPDFESRFARGRTAFGVTLGFGGSGTQTITSTSVSITGWARRRR